MSWYWMVIGLFGPSRSMLMSPGSYFNCYTDPGLNESGVPDWFISVVLPVV